MPIEVKTNLGIAGGAVVYKITVDDGHDFWEENYSERLSAKAFLKGFEAAVEFAGIGENVNIAALPAVQ